MADLTPATRTTFLCDLHTAQEAAQAGSTHDAIQQRLYQQRLYQQRTDFCSTLSVNPDLQDPSIPCIKIFQVYGHWVCHAH